MEDIVSLLLYVLMILAAFIASAYQAKKRKSQKGQGTLPPGNSERPEAGERPDFGPLADFPGMQETMERPPFYETLEAGPSVEEGGAEVERSEIYEPMMAAGAGKSSPPERKLEPEAPVVHEEVQPDLNRMNAMDYIWQQLDEGLADDIAAGEIVSVEKAAEANARKAPRERLDWRKAIIYSEILKRKEF
jgi:hypothetical protein